MSTFLMGVMDDKKRFRTVCKVGNGHDDATLEKLNKSLQMTKISQDPALVPKWLDVAKMHIPDFVISDPFKYPLFFALFLACYHVLLFWLYVAPRS